MTKGRTGGPRSSDSREITSPVCVEGPRSDRRTYPRKAMPMSDPIAESAACVANGNPPQGAWATAMSMPDPTPAPPEPSIREAVQAAVNRAITSGLVEQTLDDSIRKAITSALQNMTSQYSEFGKALQKQLAATLECGPNLDLPTYGHLVLQIVRRQVDAAMGQQLQAQIEGTLTELLASPPQSIKLTELVAAFIEHHHERRSCRCDDESPQITLLVSPPDSVGYRAIHLDPASNTDQYRCLVRIATDGAGRVYSLSLDKQEYEKRLFLGPLYSFERLLFQLHANKVPIVFDAEAEDIDTYYPGAGD